MDLLHSYVGTVAGEPLTEMFECQRYWGVMWGPTIPSFDWPTWSNDKGNPVQLTRAPSIDGEGGWFVVRMPSTDEDGWVYGTSFDRLDQPRPGGRASKRVNDHVRLRVWRKLNADQELQPLVAHKLEFATATAAAAAAARNVPAHAQMSSSQILSALTNNITYKQLPKPSVFKIWQIFMDLWNDSAKRHGLLKVVPFDPVGLYFAVKQHAKLANSQRSRALTSGRILLHAPSAPAFLSDAPANPSLQQQNQPGDHAATSAHQQDFQPGSSTLCNAAQQHAQQQQQTLRLPCASPASLTDGYPIPVARLGLSPHDSHPHAHRPPPTPLFNLVNKALPDVKCNSHQQLASCHASTAGALITQQQEQQQSPQQLVNAYHPGAQQPLTAHSLTIPARCKEGSIPARPAREDGSSKHSSGGILLSGAAASGPGAPSGLGLSGASRGEGAQGQAGHPPQPWQQLPPYQLPSSRQQHSQQAQRPNCLTHAHHPSSLIPVAHNNTGSSPLDPPPFTPSAVPSPLSLSLAPTTNWATSTVASLGGAWSALFKGEKGQQQQQQQQQPDLSKQEQLGDEHSERICVEAGATGASGPEHEHKHTHHHKHGVHSQVQGGIQSRSNSLLPDMEDPLALTEELVTIVNYARAAYGYVMAAGHMSSITSLLHMVSTSAFFNPVSGASEEANTEAIFTLTGIPKEDVVMAQWRNHVFRPCHFLAVDRRCKRLVLCIRGSLELGDICTDLAARPAAWCLGSLGACNVHQGLLSAATYVLQSTRNALVATANAHPDWPILITGHSLGAGVAALMVLMVRHGDSPLRQTQPGASSHQGASSTQPSTASAPPNSSQPPRSGPAVPSSNRAATEGRPAPATAPATNSAPAHESVLTGKRKKQAEDGALKADDVFGKPATGCETVIGGGSKQRPGAEGSAVAFSSAPAQSSNNIRNTTSLAPDSKQHPDSAQGAANTEGQTPVTPVCDEGSRCDIGMGSSSMGGQRWWPEEVAARAYCVGVACPPVVSEHAAKACEAYVLCLVHHMDFVPRLSHFSVEVALLEMVRCSPAAQLADSFLSTPLGAVVTPFFGGAGSVRQGQGKGVQGEGKEGEAGSSSTREVNEGVGLESGQEPRWGGHGRTAWARKGHQWKAEAGVQGSNKGRLDRRAANACGQEDRDWTVDDESDREDWSECDSPPCLTFSSSGPQALGLTGRCRSLPSGPASAPAAAAALSGASMAALGLPEIELTSQSSIEPARSPLHQHQHHGPLLQHPHQQQWNQAQQPQQLLPHSQSAMCLSSTCDTSGSEAGAAFLGNAAASSGILPCHLQPGSHSHTPSGGAERCQAHEQVHPPHDHCQHSLPPPLPRSVVDVMARGSGRNSAHMDTQLPWQQQADEQAASHSRAHMDIQALQKQRANVLAASKSNTHVDMQHQQDQTQHGRQQQQQNEGSLQRSASVTSRGSKGSGEEEPGLFSCWADVLRAVAKEGQKRDLQQLQEQHRPHKIVDLEGGRFLLGSTRGSTHKDDGTALHSVLSPAPKHPLSNLPSKEGTSSTALLPDSSPTTNASSNPNAASSRPALSSFMGPASTPAQHATPAEPGGPGAEQLPLTPGQALSQSLDELADAMQHKRGQPTQQAAPPLGQDKLAQQLEATKLYVPGRVLWVTYEDEPQLQRLLARRARRQHHQQWGHRKWMAQHHQHQPQGQQLYQRQQGGAQQGQWHEGQQALAQHRQGNQQPQAEGGAPESAPSSRVSVPTPAQPSPGPHFDLTAAFHGSWQGPPSLVSNSTSWSLLSSATRRPRSQHHRHSAPGYGALLTSGRGRLEKPALAADLGQTSWGHMHGPTDPRSSPNQQHSSASTQQPPDCHSAQAAAADDLNTDVDGANTRIREARGGADVGLDGLVLGAGSRKQKSKGGKGGSSTLSSRLIQGFQDVRARVESAIGNLGGGDSGEESEDERGSGGSSEVGWDGKWGFAWGDSRSSGGEGSTAPSKQQRVVLVEVERYLFEQLSLVPSCAGDHIPDVYLCALRALHAEAVLQAGGASTCTQHHHQRHHTHQHDHQPQRQQQQQQQQMLQLPLLSLSGRDRSEQEPERKQQQQLPLPSSTAVQSWQAEQIGPGAILADAAFEASQAGSLDQKKPRRASSIKEAIGEEQQQRHDGMGAESSSSGGSAWKFWLPAME